MHAQSDIHACGYALQNEEGWARGSVGERLREERDGEERPGVRATSWKHIAILLSVTYY